MRAIRTNVTLVVCSVLFFSVHAVFAQGQVWTHWGGDAGHTGTALSAPRDLSRSAWTASPSVTSGELEEFVWRSGVVADEEHVYITARHYVDDGSGLWDHTENVVICYDALNGSRLWNTPIAADVYEYDSWATPAIEQTSGTLIVASHFSVYGLDVSGGAILWECELPNVLVNASPTVSHDLSNQGVSANRVFITDYTGFDPSDGGIYAINVSPFDATGNPYLPGEIVWQDRTLPGTCGNTVAYADGFVYVGTSHGGIVRCYAALDGGTPGLAASPTWETETGMAEISQYAGFYGGVAVRNGYVYAAAYNFYGTGNTSRLYKLDADDGVVVWEEPCERTDSIPIIDDEGHIYLAAGIEGFGSAVKIQAFADQGDHATTLWDTYVDTGGSLLVGGWTHQPLLADGLLYCGTPDESQFFAPYTDMYILDVSLTPTDPGFIVEHVSGSGGSPASTAWGLYSIGADGLIAYSNGMGGDVNCDGATDMDDVAPFVMALIRPDQYAASYPGCDVLSADMNHDGKCDGLDVQAFVAILLGA